MLHFTFSSLILFWVKFCKGVESPLDCKEIQPVHHKGDQSWVFIGRTDVEAETPLFWLPDVKSWFIWKDSDAGKDWRQGKKGMTEDKMIGWHHKLNRHGFGWTSGVGDGQGGLVCCSSWGCKESDMTERLNWTELTSSSSQDINGWNNSFQVRIEGQPLNECIQIRCLHLQGNIC